MRFIVLFARTSVRQWVLLFIRGDVTPAPAPPEPTVCQGGESGRSGTEKSWSSMMDMEGNGAGERMVDWGVWGDNEWPAGDRGEVVSETGLGGEG